MAKKLALNKIEKQSLENFQEKLKEFKKEIVACKLFGSRARGEARKNSDIDILLVVKDTEKAKDKIGDFVIDTILEGGPYFSVKIYDQERYKKLNNPPTFFMAHVNRDAINLWDKKVF